MIRKILIVAAVCAATGAGAAALADGGRSASVPFVATLKAFGSDAETGPQPAASDFDDILAVQRLLYVNGFAVSGIDGRLTDETREAVRSFQRQNNLEPDGRISPGLITFLALHAVDRIADGDRVEILADSADPESGFDFAQRSNIAFVQRLLARSGFDPGRIDGMFVPATEQAIRDFQARLDLEITGEISAELIAMLDEFEQSLSGG